MCLLFKQYILLSTCLLTLSKAAPSPPTRPTTTLNLSSIDASQSNSTLAAVIPNDFRVEPSLPLDEPVLNTRDTLILTLHALGRLALDDFEEEQQSQTWRSLQHVSIDVIGPAKVVESFLPMRKYAEWGIYKAIHLMVVRNDFRSRNYALYWQEALVGFVGFNNGVYNTLSFENGTRNDGTRHGMQEGSLSLSQNALPNATAVDLHSVTTFAFKLTGRTIGESNVFMTLFTGILKAAPYPKVERVQTFFVNSGAFNTFLSLREREGLEPGGPFFAYEQLIQLLTQLPAWVIVHRDQWTESEMEVSIDDEVVGAGVMRRQIREGAGAADGGDGDVVTS